MTEIHVGDTVAYTEAELQRRGTPLGPQSRERVIGTVTDVIMSHPRAARVRWAQGVVSEVACAALQVIVAAEAVGNPRNAERTTATDAETMLRQVLPVALADALYPLPEPHGLTPRDWQDVLDVQNASNIAGVVHSLAEVMPRVMADVRWRGAGQGGTHASNTHPLVYLWVNKLADLSGHNSLDTGRYGAAYALAKLEAGQAPEWEGAEKAQGKALLLTQLYHTWYAVNVVP